LDLAVSQSACLNLADLALASLNVELLVRLSAVSSRKHALALSSGTVVRVAGWVWASLLGEVAASDDWVEELTWWAASGSFDLSARSSVEDVAWSASFLVGAFASALCGVEVGWVSVNVSAYLWGALALAGLNVEELIDLARSKVVFASALAAGWVPVVTGSAVLWHAVATA